VIITGSYIKKVEYVLYNELEIREKVLEAKNKAALPAVRNGSQISDPTAAEAIRNLEPVKAILIDNQLLMEPEKWLEVIERTRDWCRRHGEKFYRIMRGKYCRESVSAVCQELGITGDNYRSAVEDIRNYAAMWAAWYHLVAF